MIKYYDLCRGAWPPTLPLDEVKERFKDVLKECIQRKLQQGFVVYAMAVHYTYDKKSKFWELRSDSILSTYKTAGQVPDFELIWVDCIGDIPLGVV